MFRVYSWVHGRCFIVNECFVCDVIRLFGCCKIGSVCEACCGPSYNEQSCIYYFSMYVTIVFVGERCQHTYSVCFFKLNTMFVHVVSIVYMFFQTLGCAESWTKAHDQVCPGSCCFVNIAVCVFQIAQAWKS